MELERRKSGSGEFQPFLIQLGNEVRGGVATLGMGSLLRMKNLVVHPDFRRNGVGRAVVTRLRTAASDRGLALGCFAIAGEVGERLYRAVELRPVTLVVEWSRSLVAADAGGRA